MDNKRKEFLSVLLGKLLSLQDKHKHKHTEGICKYLVYEELNHLRVFFRIWPHYSGQINFPVPSPVKCTGHGMAYFKYNRWSKKSKYGRMRHELLAFLIENVLKQIKELP